MDIRMKVGTRAINCNLCNQPADINEFDYAQCTTPNCKSMVYLPVAKWNTQMREYLISKALGKKPLEFA